MGEFDQSPAMLDATGLNQLVEVLIDRGYRTVGPTVRGAAIVLADLTSADDLPRGVGVETGPGHYRLTERHDDARFGHSAGPQSWKQFIHPPRQQIWSSGQGDGDMSDREVSPDDPPLALIGVRGCDLAAIAVLDRVLGFGNVSDGRYVTRRRRMFVVAVNCTEPGGVCFCASMDTGPAVGPGYDLALTEDVTDGPCRYLVDIGSEAGADVLAAVAHRPATAGESAAMNASVDRAKDRMGTHMPPGDLRGLLADSRDSSRWDDVADRCLTCGNCTMVCPTCFCTSTEDVTDLSGEHAERWQHWASCFEVDFSYVHGGAVRQSPRSRYRQWLTHKLGTWHDQFGSSGCVGCGRCIAWCPVGIDITAEMSALAAERDSGLT